ncbi:hypothetical protein LPJ73_005358, partial [Coemansia sp. RSA 2703]
YNIPQYILERGASAREYRRRSSCVSRSSNSSIGQQQTYKEGVHSNEYNNSFDGGNLLDEDGLFTDAGLENYILDASTNTAAHVGGRGDDFDRESTAEINLRRDNYVYRPSFLGEQEARVSHMARPSNQYPHFTGRSPVTPAIIEDRTQRSQHQQQPQRFGVARPRIVHF